MGLLCSCPQSAEIADITIESCKEDVGQIQKLLFQRIYSAGVLNTFVIASANPNLLASWTTRLSASDSTKIVQTPFLSEPVTEPGEARKYGGGNATIGGVEITMGRFPTTFAGKYLRTSQKSIKDMKTYECEEEIGVFMVDQHGRIIGLSDNIDTPTVFKPIPIQGLFIGDKKLGGLEEPDSNVISFGMYANWSDNIHIVVPSNFNALNDLATP